MRSMERRSAPLVLQALLIGLLLTAAGCKQPMKPMKFNNTVVRGTQRLGVAAKTFYAAVQPIGGPLGGRGPAKVADAQSAYTDMQKGIGEAKKMFAELSPPPNSPKGAELLAKARDLMEVQQSIFDQCMTPMLQIVKDNVTYPDIAAQWAAVGPLLIQAQQLERPAYEALTKAQSEYCKEYNFEPR